MKIRNYVVTHKKKRLSENLKKNGYRLISVGPANDENNEGVHDNTLENISEKNPNYCELTALYWIWKNDHTSDIKGLCHYRRYFTNATISQSEKYFLTKREMAKAFKEGYDIIAPIKSRYIRPADYNYLVSGKKKDLVTLRQVISEKYPEYLKEYDYLLKHNFSYLTNMMIAQKETFDAYCEWLFDILFEVEKRTDLTGYTPAEARIYGYMSERLLTVYMLHNHLNVKEVRSVNIEEKNNFSYKMREFNIKIHIYQGLKTILYMFNKHKKEYKNFYE